MRKYLFECTRLSVERDSKMENEEQKKDAYREGTVIQNIHPSPGLGLTYRDDQHDFYELLDILRSTRKKRGLRFRLVDSGVYDLFQMEDLLLAGADLYTSDLERTSSQELAVLLKAARNSGSIVAFFVHGELILEERENSLNLASLSLLGRDGLIIHVSNREKERSVTDLTSVAVQCRQGWGRLIYYHHGALPQELDGLVSEGAWLHVTQRSLQSEQDSSLFRDLLFRSQAAGANGILHIEKDLSLEFLRDAIDARAVVLFKTQLKDFKSLLRPLEDKARKTQLDFRSFYLSPESML
jgi:hypothetical protein